MLRRKKKAGKIGALKIADISSIQRLQVRLFCPISVHAG